MRFCPRCDNILLIKRKGKAKDKKNQTKIMFCSSCGYEEPFEEEKDKEAFTLTEKLVKTGKERTVVLTTRIDGGKSVDEDDRDAFDYLFEDGGED